MTAVSDGPRSLIDGDRPNTPVGTPLRLPKASELVAAHLRRQIIRGELANGQMLPSEAALIQQFGVSRPTLREALRLLEAESLISIRRGAHGGMRVHPPDGRVAATYTGLMLQYQGTTLEDVYEARLAIELGVIRRLALERTKSDLVRLRQAAEKELPISESPGSSILEQTIFHSVILEVGRNKTLALFNEMIHEIIDLANYSRATSTDAQEKSKRSLQRAARAHIRIVDLIEAKDVSGVVELWTAHLIEAKEYALGARSSKTVLDLLDQTPATPRRRR